MTSDNEIIIITAASTGSWVRSVLHPSSWVRQWGEGLIGDYKKQMQVLRRVDHNIAVWANDLEAVVKEARKAFKAKRMVDVALLLAALNKRLKLVATEGKKVEVIRDKAIRQFEAEHKIDLPEKFNPKELPFGADDGLTSLAGWGDFKRKWVARRLEDKHREARDKAIEGLLRHTESTVKSVKKLLGHLGEARDKGNIGTYVTVISEISKEQHAFERLFSAVYFKYLQKYLEEAYEAKMNKEDQDAILAKEQVPATVKEVVSDTVNEMTVRNPQIEGFVAQQVENNVPPIYPPSSGTRETAREEFAPSVPTLPSSDIPATQSQKELFPPQPETVRGVGRLGPISNDQAPDTEADPTRRSNDLEQILQQTAHADFINQLIIVGKQNDPYLMAAMIAKYAGQVEEYDLEKSLELMAIAEYILDNE